MHDLEQFVRRWLALTVAVAALWPSLALANERSGFAIAIGKFTLTVCYTDTMDYADGADLAIRDPRRALFSLATVLQANADAVAEIPHDLWLWVDVGEVGQTPSALAVLEDSPEGMTSVGGSELRGGAEEQLVAALCGRYPRACARPPSKTLDLYRCARGKACPGQIQLGALDPETGLTGLTVLRPKGPRVKRVQVRRQDMTRYFR